MGNIAGSKIWRITRYLIYELANEEVASIKVSERSQFDVVAQFTHRTFKSERDAKYLDMVRKVLDNYNFIYSTTRDITKSIQHAESLKNDADKNGNIEDVSLYCLVCRTSKH